MLLITLFLSNLVLSFWYAFWYWEGWRVIKDEISIVNTFNFARIHFLDPTIWYIAFAVALAVIWKYAKLGKYLVILVLIAQSLYLFVLFLVSYYLPIQQSHASF